VDKKIGLVKLNVGLIIFAGFIEFVFYWLLSKIRWWLPIIPIFFLYVLPTLYVTYANMPVEEKTLIMVSWLVVHSVASIGGALAESVIKTGERLW